MSMPAGCINDQLTSVLTPSLWLRRVNFRQKWAISFRPKWSKDRMTVDENFCSTVVNVPTIL
jgi:hypothetical protein